MQELDDYLNEDFLDEGNPELLEKIRPVFMRLVDALKELGPAAPEAQYLAVFAEALKDINRYEDEIETVEREAILDSLYSLGEMVGLKRESAFAEEWRGDW